MPVPTRLEGEGVKPEVEPAYTLYVAPAGEPALQLSLMWVDETAVAVRFRGAPGGGGFTVSVNKFERLAAQHTSPP